MDRSLPATFQPYLNTERNVIGRTAATRFEPNTSSEFHFWLDNRTYEQGGDLEIGNIVVAGADDGWDLTFGVVVAMKVYSDVDSFLADYLSHDYGNASIQVPTDIEEVLVVTCDVARNISGKTRPVVRSSVYYPSPLGIEYAMGLAETDGRESDAEAAIPLGVYENGDGTLARICIEESFLVGSEGAHLNIAGVSGLASKTSAMQFFLKSTLIHCSKRVAAVVLNVKSKDLLYMDLPNPRLLSDEWSLSTYRSLGIPPEPFLGARYFAPARPGAPGAGRAIAQATQSLRELPVEAISWDLQMMYRDIPTLFSPLDWDDRLEGVWLSIVQEIERGSITTYQEMLDWVDKLLTGANGSQRSDQWVRGCHIATWFKMRNHLQRFPEAYKGLITLSEPGRDVAWVELQDRSVYVVDIQMLADPGMKLVFGRVVRALKQILESGKQHLDAVLLVVDELNRFAPAAGERSPLKAQLIDISARGRSLGLVLVGAEQFMFAVDREVVENSTTYLLGRTGPNELRAPTYSMLSDEIKGKLTTLAQGSLLVQSAKFAQPLFMRFPFPPALPGNQYRGRSE